MSDNRTDLPAPSSPNFSARVREAVMTYLGRQGNPLDRGLTLRDLIDAGVIRFRSGYTPRTGGVPVIEPGPDVGEPYETDLTPPPTPTGFSVTAAISHIFVTVDPATYTQGHGHLRTRVYGKIYTGGALPVFADATEIDQFDGQFRAIASNPSTTWYVWVKWESQDGVLSVSPAGGTNGIAVTTGQDVSTLLTALTGQITQSQLFASLGARIDLIDASSAVPGSVDARILVETNTRASQIAAETNQRLLAVQDAATNALNALLAVNTEITDRQADTALVRSDLTAYIDAGISAEASSRTTLASQLRGNYTGSDLNALTSGLIYSERTTRASQVDGLAQQITLLSAGSGEQFDYKTIWYFDAGIEGWSGNGAPTASNGWLRPANVGSGAYVDSPSGLNIDGVTYSQVKVRIRKTGSPAFAGYLWWKGNGDSTWDVSRRTALSSPSYDGNGIAQITVNAGWAVTISEIRLDLSDAQTGTDYFEYDWIAIGRPSPGASAAALLDEASARASADSAEVTARQTLATALFGANDPTGVTLANVASGLIYEEKTARVAQDSSFASSISTLTSSVDANTAAITSEQTTRANADIALTTSVNTLQASVNTPTIGNNPTYAAVQTEITTRASETGTIFGRYSVKVDVNGYVSGFGLISTANDGVPTSDFIIRADKFAIASPGGPGITPTVPFVVVTTPQTINGVSVGPGVYVDGLKVQGGSITNAQLANAAIDDAKIANLSADKITVGTLAAARIAVGSLDANRIIVGTITADRMITGLMSADNVLTRGLTVRDNAGNVILSAGVPLGSSFITPASGWLNSNITISAGAIQGIGTGAGTAVANSAITLNSNGTLSGAGGGAVTAAGIAAVETSLANAPAGILNSNISISSNGTLSGGGGGTVTAAGISAVETSLANAPAAILNSSITINTAGVLTGGGGGQVTLTGLGAGAFATLSQITSGNISTYIASAAIGTAYIQNAAITNALIDNLAVTNAKIANSAIDNAKIADATILSAKIADAQITTAKIADANITNAKIADLSVETLKIAGNAVTIPTSSYVSGGQVFTVETNIGTLTFTSTGAPVYIHFSCSMASDGTNSSAITVRLKNGSTTLATQQLDVPVSKTAGVSIAVAQTPSAGSVTYNVTAQSATGVPTASQRSLFALETKK